MKKLFNNGSFKFVADALVPSYKNQGWVEEGETTPPPQLNPSEDKTASEGAVNGTAANEEVFACPVCGKTYKTEAGLNKHMAKEHPDA